jgi:hypothetical protein
VLVVVVVVLLLLLLFWGSWWLVGLRHVGWGLKQLLLFTPILHTHRRWPTLYYTHTHPHVTDLHLLAAHEHGHLLLEVADDAGVHPQEPRALHQLVDLAHRRVAVYVCVCVFYVWGGDGGLVD